jgi:Ca2+-transporting ATPase
LDDNFSTIVHTIEDGRRIFDNIRKAVGYVFTIHIPIAFAAMLAPLLGISPASLMLLPLHVVLLELVIDPTCSVVLERQPAEKDIMERAPRSQKEKLLNAKILTKSILQGLVIFAASFGTYFEVLTTFPENADLARTMGLAVIMLSNILLVQVNSSDTRYAFQTFIFLIKDKVMWAVTGGTILGLLVMLYTPLSAYLKLTALSMTQFLTVVGISFIAVMWYEIVKLVKSVRARNSNNNFSHSK